MRSSSRSLQMGSAPSATVWTRALRGLLDELAIARVLLAWLPIWLLLIGFLVGLAVAYQIPHSYSIDVGSPRDQAYVRNFHTRLAEPGHVYRWSGVYGYVSLPGLGGSRPFTMGVELDPARYFHDLFCLGGNGLFRYLPRLGRFHCCLFGGPAVDVEVSTPRRTA